MTKYLALDVTLLTNEELEATLANPDLYERRGREVGTGEVKQKLIGDANSQYRQGEFPNFVTDAEARPRWIAFKSVKPIPAGVNISMYRISLITNIILTLLFSYYCGT